MKLAVVGLLVLAGCAAEGGDDAPGPGPGDGTPLVTPTGTSLGPVTTVEIGPDGGRAATADGRIAIDVPAGAVASTTPFTIEPITNGVPGAIGAAFRLGPHGQTFAAPVTLTFGYDAAALGGNDPEVLMVSYQTADGGWSFVPAVAADPAARTLSVQTTHFSDWSLATGFNLSPLHAEVPTAGQQRVEFQLCWTEPYECRWEPENGVIDPGCALVCERELGGLDIQWTVNGTEGGTLDDGTIGQAAGSSQAIYTAPARAPEPDTVQVAARCASDCVARGGAVIAFATIKIIDKPWYVGHVNTRTEHVEPYVTLITTSAATVTFAYDADDQRYHPIDGMVHATREVIGNGCTQSVAYDGPLGHGDGDLAVVGTVYLHHGFDPDATYHGTLTCENGASGPVTVEDAVGWWLNHSSGTLPIQPDGSLAETQSYTLANGTQVTQDWLLVPVDPGEAE